MVEPIQETLKGLLPDFRRTGLLDLRSQALTDADIEAIAAILKTDFSNVTQLLLSTNQLGDQGAKCIAALFPQLANLKYVDLQSNQITDRGAIDLLTAATTADRHVELALHGNVFKRPADITKVEQALSIKFQGGQGVKSHP